MPNKSTARTLVYARGGISEFSRYSGYSTTYISKCLNGERKISPAFRDALAEWLNQVVCPIEEEKALGQYTMHICPDLGKRTT